MYYQKKDYLLSLIETLGKHISDFFEKKKVSHDFVLHRASLDKCLDFYLTNFDVRLGDSVDEILNKLPAVYFIEEYARLLMYDYEMADNKNSDNLKKSLDLLDYAQRIDRIYSWERLALQQNILQLIEV